MYIYTFYIIYTLSILNYKNSYRSSYIVKRIINLFSKSYPKKKRIRIVDIDGKKKNISITKKRRRSTTWELSLPLLTCRFHKSPVYIYPLRDLFFEGGGEAAGEEGSRLREPTTPMPLDVTE